jgi:hypothetical protein
LCTDQSNFDLHQRKEWVVYALEVLFKKIETINPWASVAIKAELRSLQEVDIVYDNRKLTWGKGVLSGYKFTALVDSILNRAETRTVLSRRGINKLALECYQGDDAIVGLFENISKGEIALEYQNLGLEVHPAKTWYGRGATEFLHEIYAPRVVYGFPARSFKALAWKSPMTLSSEKFGADKLNSLIKTCLMCHRRGLLIYPQVKRILKQYGLSTEGGFTAWLRTPTLFGGFGAGTSGRVKLVMKVSRNLKFKIQVNGLWGGKLYSEAARARVETSCPLPGLSLSLNWGRVGGSRFMPAVRMSRFAEVGVMRLDWYVNDLERYSDAYKRKLTLEWKLRRRELIMESDLPVRYGFENVDFVYRRYKKLLNMALSVETSMGNSETYSFVSSWANRVWAGVALEWAQEKLDSWVRLRKQLCMTIHSMVNSKSFQSNILEVRV